MIKIHFSKTQMIDEIHRYILLDLSKKKKERAFICLRWKYTFNVKRDCVIFFLVNRDLIFCESVNRDQW